MANVLKLRETARALELKSQWRPALEAYRRIVEEDGEDHAIWNRIGDLHLRLGEAHRAIEAYEHGMEAYADAGLLNNAIALCNKILRIAPDRTVVYRRLAQFSAAQGFLADARAQYLKYVERMRKLGHPDEAAEALREAARILPDDVEVSRMLAEQLHSAGHTGQAVETLQLLLGRLDPSAEEAEAVRTQLRTIDPRAEVTPPPAHPRTTPHPGESASSAGGAEPTDDAPPQEMEIERAGGFESFDPPAAGTLEGFEHLHDARPEAPEEMPLPMMDLHLESLHGAEESAADEGRTDQAEPHEELPLISFDEEWSGASYGRALWEDSAADDAHTPETHHAELAAAGRYAEAVAAIRKLIEQHEEDTELYQQQVEYAVRSGEREALIQAHLDLAHHLTGAGSAAKARVVFERVLELDPDNDEAQRALAPAPPPYRPAGAARDDSHYAAGIAHKEAGRLDEAIAELQTALRSGERTVESLEALGECFVARGQAGLAVRVLERALHETGGGGEALLGVHYWLARSHEALGQPDAAREHYEQVLAFDILYRDARARLQALPGGGAAP